MYEYIIGALKEQYSDSIVVECQKIGYLLKTSNTTLQELPAMNAEVKLYLHQVIKEDEHALYGFMTTDEREMFRTMIGISGIGPKAAMGLLSQFSRGELIMHILNNDPKAIAKAPGIGLKTASRIILELKDRFKDVKLDTSDVIVGIKTGGLAQEATEALLGLGFLEQEASQMVKSIYSEELSLEELIAGALRGANPLKGR
ncbi:Holliday junction branch migration protein RuvA [Eubacteriaceae bacterium ES3]|nr:Holliday junction branch migration protein RuvA [Eubacteriaceae bacterium ES3]